MNNFPKLLIVAGIALIVIGLIWAGLGRFINLGRLPGDIAVEKGNVKFYFPIVTCIIISIVLSLIAYIARWFFK
jgi:heme/copper-type cytochrome/quinol oxidase subunit 2